MPPKLLIATRNMGKLRELTDLLGHVPFELVSLNDVGVDVEVEETGNTFEENAALKAETYAQLSGLPTLADDSGLEVDALNGEPGVRSARYAGDDATDADRIAFLLRKLDNIPQQRWSARFRCVIALSWPGETTDFHPGACEGMIVPEPRGTNGFGYDPVFLVTQMNRTMAELTADEKNGISHRSVAAQKMAMALMSRA